MSKYQLTAPATPGATPTVRMTGTLSECRKAAQPLRQRRDLKGQDVRIERADGSLREYAGPNR